LTPDPDHLFEQADRLMLPLAAEAEPRQTDLRRAISSAYFALFHFTLAAASDLFVGWDKRSMPEYQIMYRSVSHDWLRSLCEQLQRKRIAKIAPHAPGVAFFGPVVIFAATVAELQELRHSADYDPSFSITVDEAKFRIDEARKAVKLFQEATDVQRVAFLTLLMFNIRQTKAETVTAAQSSSLAFQSS
jgi:uncharacterized protein (UPF0332 family)